VGDGHNFPRLIDERIPGVAAVVMANDPPFATLNHFTGDLGIPSESDSLRIGISLRLELNRAGLKNLNRTIGGVSA
jgi:hypothetical protein